jgi:hypothetical protein
MAVTFEFGLRLDEIHRARQCRQRSPSPITPIPLISSSLPPNGDHRGFRSHRVPADDDGGDIWLPKIRRHREIELTDTQIENPRLILISISV